jgi:hypothetical protein
MPAIAAIKATNVSIEIPETSRQAVAAPCIRKSRPFRVG